MASQLPLFGEVPPPIVPVVVETEPQELLGEKGGEPGPCSSPTVGQSIELCPFVLCGWHCSLPPHRGPHFTTSDRPPQRVLFSAEGAEGMAVRVVELPAGFSVILHDADAGEDLPTILKFEHLDAAIDHARSLISA